MSRLFDDYKDEFDDAPSKCIVCDEYEFDCTCDENLSVLDEDQEDWKAEMMIQKLFWR